MKVTMLDFGAGNLHSLGKALCAPNVDVETVVHPLAALETDVLILPGVGAFGRAAATLAPMRERVRRAITDGLPCLGICLGMQLLFERSDEGFGDGLGVLEGRVRRLKAKRVPHIGWNTLNGQGDGVAGLGMAYFANSYVCVPTDGSVVSAWTEHEGDRFVSAVRRGNVAGVQFHPEKSGAAGVRYLRALLSTLTKGSTNC